MIRTVNFEGVKATVRKANFTILGAAFLAVSAFILTGCPASGPNTNSGTTTVDPNSTAATVNGKAIKLEEVERLIKQQGQGQEVRLSPLELAQARLQVLQGLIQQEVLFQKAEKEGVVPSEDDVTAELNRLKTSSGKSEEQWKKDMETLNETDASLREKIKKQLAVKKLEDKITGKVEPPKDQEINDFYSGNKEAFVKKKGVKLAAIVIDPANNGENDQTKNDADAVRVGNEVINQLKQNPDSFSQIARERSEDQSRLQGGELGYIAEEEMRQTFPAQLVATLMSPQTPIGNITAVPMQGKYFIIKLQERSDRDEDLTLESPGVRQQVVDSLINARKQLLVQSYAAVAMNEAKIENALAQKIVSNPNELSGARPAGPAATPSANANVGANTNTATVTNSAPNANASNNARPANAPANRPANAPANRPANTANANAR
jgi:peptidyl-prolyl cis-trans isomerase SurA